MATTASTAPAREGFRAAPGDGDAARDLLSAAPKFKDRLYRAIRPYLHGLVLEVGGGNVYSQRLLDDGYEVYLGHGDHFQRHLLRKRFGMLNHFRGVLPFDLADEDFDAAYGYLFGQFGAVIARNVLQRLSDDGRAVANAAKLLRPGGHLIVLTPALPLLYGRPDRERGDLRRYTRRGLRQLFAANGLDKVRSMYLNLAAMLGLLVGWRVDLAMLAVGRKH
jgi:SAM-dependent methyltransferase